MKALTKVALLTLLGAGAGILVAYYQYLAMTPDVAEALLAQLGSIEMLFLVSGLQTAALTAVAAAVGFKLRKKLDLPETKMPDRSGILAALAIGFASSLVITLSEKYIFLQYLPADMGRFSFSPLYFAAAILYGGIIEEVLLRLGLMTVILWLFTRSERKLNVTKGHGDAKCSISSFKAWAAIGISALLFALGHLPATAQMIGLSVPIVIRSLLLNGFAGVGFGWLYWKKGLLYAMLGHVMAHVFNQLVLMPLFM